MEYTITMADICELAHQYTVSECEDRGLVVDDKWSGDETYTPEAQTIYDKHYKLITETLGV